MKAGMNAQVQYSPYPVMVLLAATLLAGILLAGCAPQPAAGTAPAGELARILKNGVLVIATDSAYRPQSELKSNLPRLVSSRCELTQYTANQLEGFDVDVAVE